MLLQVEQIRADIRDFQQSSGVDKVIILWTANTERFTDVIPGVNDSAHNLLAAIQVRYGSICDIVCVISNIPPRYKPGMYLRFSNLIKDSLNSSYCSVATSRPMNI